MRHPIPSAKASEIFTDDRGYFALFIDNKEVEVKRVYYVVNPARGTVRGFHFHKKEWKYFTIVRGSAKFVALDPKKPKEKFTFISSERSPAVISIPPGYANGWVSLEDTAILLCASTATTKESLKDDKRFDPYKWGDVWSVKGK